MISKKIGIDLIRRHKGTNFVVNLSLYPKSGRIFVIPYVFYYNGSHLETGVIFSDILYKKELNCGRFVTKINDFNGLGRVIVLADNPSIKIITT